MRLSKGTKPVAAPASEKPPGAPSGEIDLKARHQQIAKRFPKVLAELAK